MCGCGEKEHPASTRQAPGNFPAHEALALDPTCLHQDFAFSLTKGKPKMNPVRTVETQTTHASFMSSLPSVCANRPYEIIDYQVLVHDGTRQIRIKFHDEPIRHLGSLDLPMEKLVLIFDGYTEDEADQFMRDFRTHSFRAGGG